MARMRFMVSFLAAYVLEAVAIWLYLHRIDQPYFVYGAFGAHILSSLSFVFITAPKPRALPGIAFYYPRLSALFSFFMPVLGLIGISLTMIMVLGFMKRKGLAEEYREKSYEGIGVEVDLPTDITEFLYDEVDVHPIADILAGDDMGMKRGAVNLLRRIGSAEAVKLLRRSLSDDNAEVRFYAHTALTRLEEDYAEALDKARFRVQRYETAKSHAELASTCRNYARSGLPEKNMVEQTLNIACEQWRKAVEMEPENKDYQVRLAESYCEINNYTDGLALYQKLIAFPEYELESCLGICRIYFDQGDYPALYRKVLEMQSKPVPDSNDPFKKGAYNFWISYFGNSADENGQNRDSFDVPGVVI